jgi:hypothetical protein
MLTGFLIRIEQVVIGGLLTWQCIHRFAMEYHHKPYGFEVPPSP